ncbi:sensor histidine kinase [Pedobacter yonginense]|nr:histidine kinase [Pedobacter yonginense]
MNGDPPPIMSIWNYSVLLIWIFIKYALFAFSYYYATENIKQQKQLRLMEREKHEAEYAFLRAQINPHFLNNTLNFFYAKSLTLSAELSEGIMILSEIMRYSLEIDKDDKTALLDHELAHIRNVIKINQLRFNNKLQLDFDVKGDTKNVRIIPLVLITMVENILKHGDCTDKLNPVYIILSISELDGLIYFNASNKKKTGPKELSSGIGVVNIRKRLAHHYGSNFTLEIKEGKNDYNIELRLPIL